MNQQPKQLVAVNIKCDKKNRFYNIEGMSEAQIQEISSRYKFPEWTIIRR
jgi:hypothetical protein